MTRFAPRICKECGGQLRVRWTRIYRHAGTIERIGGVSRPCERVVTIALQCCSCGREVKQTERQTSEIL
jgi:hypothetical protein